MAYFNMNIATKFARAQQIVSQLGSTFYLLLYSGTDPACPDMPVPSGNLLGTLTNSGNASASASVLSAVVNNAGSGGTNGTATVTGTTGTGTKFQANVTISGGSISAVNSITTAGNYTALPTNPSAEPVTGGGLTGATLALQMQAQISMAFTTANATASGTAAFARVSTSATAGGAGVVDEDVGTSGTSFTINTTNIAANGPIVVSSATVTEA